VTQNLAQERLEVIKNGIARNTVFYAELERVDMATVRSTNLTKIWTVFFKAVTDRELVD